MFWGGEVDLYNEQAIGWWPGAKKDSSKGRAIRVFARIIKVDVVGKLQLPEGIKLPEKCTYGEALEFCRTGDAYDLLNSLPISIRVHTDPELHKALLDLGFAILWDTHLACGAAFDGDPFPGVDTIIEPVSDDHVSVVITAMQRELHRELRRVRGGSELRPAVQLATFPWEIQRALVERRRWRYHQWGITTESWKRGRWSFWEIPEDTDWEPPWATPVVVSRSARDAEVESLQGLYWGSLEDGFSIGY